MTNKNNKNQYMKTPSYLIAVLFSLISIISCSDKNSSSQDNAESSQQLDERPLHPDVQTDFGKIGDYQTMDEYYLDDNGKKVWHGYRKNLYPTGQPKTVSFYEHGNLQWTETYDEVGNILTSNR